MPRKPAIVLVPPTIVDATEAIPHKSTRSQTTGSASPSRCRRRSRDQARSDFVGAPGRQQPRVQLEEPEAEAAIVERGGREARTRELEPDAGEHRDGRGDHEPARPALRPGGTPAS